MSPVRDQISHRMQGSTATPVDENNWRRKRREVGYIPARVYPSPIQLESLRTMHRSSRRPRDTGELAQCLFVACPKVGRCKGRDEVASTHLNSANIRTHVNLSMTSTWPSLNMAMEGDPRTRAVGKYVRSDKRSARRKVWRR